jgi:RNA polymerase sigma-70 factor (ECF subfamily)
MVRTLVDVDRTTRLAVDAATGDADALRQFVAAAWDPVWRTCAALVDVQAADDLTQEVLARAVAALPGFRRQSSARTWLAAIARHVCTDELRVRSRRRHLEDHVRADAIDASGHVTTASDADVAGAVSIGDLVARLDPDRRTAFVLTQVAGLTYAEAAEVCGCPIGTIRSRVARARDDLVAMVDAADVLAGRARTVGTLGSERSATAG